jgi:hypothetical protein
MSNMTIELVPETSLQYYLICFDDAGQERNEDDGTCMSETVLQVLVQEPITDIFIFSHGWQGDIPAARSQYGRWIKAMADNTADIEKLKQMRPNFNPLLIGLHWPSQPWGDEDMLPEEPEKRVDEMVARYTAKVADSLEAKDALKTIFAEAMVGKESDGLPQEIAAAYGVLNKEMGLNSAGIDGAPGSDCEPFDAASIYENSPKDRDTPEPGLFDIGRLVLGRMLSPLRVLSYWRMKERARQFGENAGFNLLTKLQQAASEQARFHLVGHSFGCIVVSATLGGPKVNGNLPRPVNSLTLIQGALSLWSYCADIPVKKGTAGYFYPVVKHGKVAGPILTTTSRHDSAVGKMYPLASTMAMKGPSFDITVGQLPQYGAIGTFGLQGDGLDRKNSSMLPCTQDYNFEAGKIYNLESSKYICKIPPDAGLGGAHSSIDEPEVAHAVWMAAMVGLS